jgi:hypothetical protein
MVDAVPCFVVMVFVLVVGLVKLGQVRSGCFLFVFLFRRAMSCGVCWLVLGSTFANSSRTRTSDKHRGDNQRGAWCVLH